MKFKNRIVLAVLRCLLVFLPFFAQASGDTFVVPLNGNWQMGFARVYTTTGIVPSIATDPTRMNDEMLWYKKEIELPKGKWKTATLELKGARFQPQVFINGELVGKRNGGMAPVFFRINSENIKPGKTITLEIALQSLKNVPQTDASYIPGSDQWRSNVSSGLWDEVVLHLHGEVSIDRAVPFVDYKSQKVKVQFDLNGATDFKGKATVEILDKYNKVAMAKTAEVFGLRNTIEFAIDGKLKSWSPSEPNLYRLQLTIVNNKGQVIDRSNQSLGIKKFKVVDKQFYLNGDHFVAKGVTVVWHRWVRSKEGRELGYDTAWFHKNIIQHTKDLGGNYLRFHLGLPPERFLDMCDRYGLVVQYEWSFFHGMPASKQSLVEQYKNWLDLAMRHPCVSLIHPYNETGGDELKIVWAALDELLPAYPPLVIEDRDVMHIHKYWWSLFENVGLFYDSANVFPNAVMSDEFGGNYLDENGDMGGYPTVKETYLRFLGRNHTTAQRLELHKQANARIAEYWRRIGAAGFSPFCALASKEDGNTWFMGTLKDGKPKPVWNALAAAFSPQSVSIDVWDRNFEPGQSLNLPVYIFNDEHKEADLSVKITIENKEGKVFSSQDLSAKVNAFSKNMQQVAINMPSVMGDYIIKAELVNRPLIVKYPVVSEWNFRVFKASVPENVKNLKIAIAKDESELRKFLSSLNIATVELNDKNANVILTSLQTWNRIANGDTVLSTSLKKAVLSGKSVVMLDVGDRPLGQGYPEKPGDFGPLQGVVRVSNPKIKMYNLFSGIALKFAETAEPESFIHPDKANRELWNNLQLEYTGLFNGLRGGLIVPAMDMEFIGLSAKAFTAQWKQRGANEEKIVNGPYYAYELQGFYEFSDKPNDAATQKKLKDKVFFLVQDAPALANSINPLTPVAITDLAKGYKDAEKGIADNLIPLANCAKNLTQTPVALVDFGQGKGKLIVSQLLTKGRLAKGFGETGLYGIRYDEVAVQYVLNMISVSVAKSK